MTAQNAQEKHLSMFGYKTAVLEYLTDHTEGPALDSETARSLLESYRHVLETRYVTNTAPHAVAEEMLDLESTL